MPISYSLLNREGACFFSRTNANATRLLMLLNAYQKKYVVDILSYHQCDSQTRNPPELDCLIKLQAQNVQQRHIVFLTGRKSLLGLPAVCVLIITHAYIYQSLFYFLLRKECFHFWKLY